MIATINKIYRFIFCRGGYGVHSPFVFDLITNVIEDKYAYYSYEKFNVVRKQLKEDIRKIKCKNRRYTVKEVFRKFCFSKHEGRLLFRLANHFQSRTIYVVGCDLGLMPLYLNSWSKSTHCVVFETEQEPATIARNVVEKYSSALVEILYTFNPEDFNNSSFDLIVWGKQFSNSPEEKENNYSTFSIEAFNRLLPFIKKNSIMVISEINASRKNKDTWRKVCAANEVTVTLDLYSLGIVFFDPKLHRKTYNSFV